MFNVPSERVFSTAGDIVTAHRSALKSEFVDMLIFLKKNWNQQISLHTFLHTGTSEQTVVRGIQLRLQKVFATTCTC